MQSPALPDGSIPPILRLATELHLNIVSQLKDADEGGAFAARHLRLTNRHFYNIVEQATHSELLRVEQTEWAMERRLYACMYCIRLRHASKFADTMLKGKTGRNGTQTYRRFCVDCGFAPPKGQTRYSAGTEVRVNGTRWVWCQRCKVVKSGDVAGKAGCFKLCETCFRTIYRRSDCRCVDWRCKRLSYDLIEPQPGVYPSESDSDG